MKTILLLISAMLSLRNADAQVTGQPECVGLTLGGSWKYATLIDLPGTENDGLYYFTCSHWRPQTGEILTFGNGDTAEVESTNELRGGYWNNQQYELAIGKLKTRVTAKPVAVWWSRGFSDIRRDMTLRGYGIDGWYTGYDCFTIAEHPSEINQCVLFTAPAGVVRSGYSGSPVFMLDGSELKLLGINWGTWSSTGDPVSRGIATMIGPVLQEYPELFPQFLQPPPTPSVSIATSGGMMLITLRSGNPAMQITMNEDPSQYQWYPADRSVSSLGYVECPSGPWETVLKWDPQIAPRVLFRGDDSWSEEVEP